MRTITFFSRLKSILALGLIAMALIGSYNYVYRTKTEDLLPLYVGMLSADAPFMSINEHGEYEGFDVDVAQAIATEMGKKLVIKDMGLAELFVALEKGNIDLLMCGLSITKERLKKLAMVHYQGEGVTSYPLVFWQTVPEGVASLEDLHNCNATICVLPGTTQEKFLSRFPYITIKVMNNYPDIILDLQYGKATAAFFDSAIKSYIQQFPQLRIIHIPLNGFEEFGHGIALRKNNFKLAEQVATIVQKLKDNSIITGFEQTWNMGEVS